LNYALLPDEAKPMFIREARKQRKIDYDESEEEVRVICDELILEEYASNIHYTRALSSKALGKLKQ
jgi:hypothetical protein